MDALVRFAKSRSIGEWLNLLGPLFGLILVFALFAGLRPKSFPTLLNLETITRQTAIVGIGALGMTMVIIAGGIDLAAGSIIAFTTVVIALILKESEAPGLVLPFGAAVAGVAAGALCGAVSGLAITQLKMIPFIVTLGMLLIVRGAAKGLGQERAVRAPASWLENLLSALGPGEHWMLVPPGVWVMAVLAVVVWIALRYTRFGRHVFAIGSNELTARLCGVAVERVKLAVYALCGAFAGMAGVMQFSRLTIGDPTVATGLELDIIAAVVIGGGSLSGGVGSVGGSIIGALIMTMISNGCSQVGLPNWVQQIVTGGIIVAAVALDRWRHGRE